MNSTIVPNNRSPIREELKILQGIYGFVKGEIELKLFFGLSRVGLL